MDITDKKIIRIGVLSDTHMLIPDKRFQAKAEKCFADADLILHAGDLTSLAVLEVFSGKKVHAVHGNMCSPKTRNILPGNKIISVGNFRIALIHGAGHLYNIEEKLFNFFAPIDCIVYGHTHKAVCHRYGPTLMMNPGSFTSTGLSGTYGTITLDANTIEGRIHSAGPSS